MPAKPTVRFDASRLGEWGDGLGDAGQAHERARLEAARDEVFADLVRLDAGEEIPPEHQPLDARFLSLPDRLLGEFAREGAVSELARIQVAADAIASEVDRFIVIGIGGSYMGARALFEALCRPLHNEHSRARRNERPRLYFAGNNVDSDALEDLLDLVSGDPDGHGFGAVAISKSGGTLEPAASLRRILQALRKRSSDQEIARRLMLVTGERSRLSQIGGELGCRHVFPVPDAVGGRYSVLSAVGLLPAAVLGLDVHALLEGARDLTERVRTAPAGDNPALDWIGCAHRLEAEQGIHTRVMCSWGGRLEAFGLWYDQLLSESLGKGEQGATPITAVATRDLHSRGQQHQDGRRDKLITNLIVEQPSLPAAPIGPGAGDLDGLDALSDLALADVLEAALDGTNRAYAQANRPTVDLRVPELNAYTLGQLFQLAMIATAIEGRLIGVNPYGQPGVEDYKREMGRALDERAHARKR